eukprot:TRINITY_DN6495_c0_g1_i5.p1 TRINITY_DN6495_c0_g1~~TRINITY_DN6495_c0_g1_i5.p1  ORF type:complete len:387 (-),score=61.53 TRINITY_DN6495_c0_g1_i5:164-1324(-)
MEAHQRRVITNLSSIIFLTTLIIPCILASKQCDFPAVFNFGDSNSDTGGLSAAFGPAPPPHGKTYFHHPTGRYCDGRLIVDFIAQSVGLPYLHAYLDSIAPNFAHGANFATAGSTIRTQNTTLFQSGFSPISLNVQFWEFSQFRTRSQLPTNPVFKNLLPKEEYFSKGLYTFDIGQNDLGAAYFSGMTTDEVIAAVPDILKHFSEIIKDIYGQGGRSFWIHNTAPIGCLPYVLEKLPIRTPEVDRYSCGSPFNSVAQYFNEKLKELVVQLRKDLPLAALTYVDIYSVKHNLITHAKKYGFEHPLVACCGHGGKYNFNPKVGCGATKNINGTAVLIGKPCKNPSVRVSWDGIHFTEAANKWIFNQIVDGAFSDPPLPLRLACHREAQ